MDKVKFEVVVWGGGWEDYKLSVNDTEHYLLTTCIWAKYELGELIEALCCMSPDFYQYCYGTDYAYLDRCDKPFRVIKKKNGDRLVESVDEEGYEGGDIVFCEDIPQVVHLSWDAEGRSTDWIIERTITADNDFTLRIRIETHYEDEEQFDFTVSYKEFALAVADGCIKALKRHGFFGWEKSNYGHQLDLKQIIYLKAIGKDRLPDIEMTCPYEKEGEVTSFEKEMDILFS